MAGAAHGHARQPHVDPHRRASPVTTASSTTRGTTARRGEQVITNSQATWPWAMQHLVAGVEIDPRRGAPHLARRVHRVGQRAVRRRRRLLHLRLLPPRRGAADPEGPVRPPAHDRAVRAPVEGLLVVVGRRPHGHRAGRRHLERQLPRRSRTRCPRFMWCNFTLTDAAMHEGGPYSEIAAASVRDSDAPHRRGARRGRAARRVRRHRVRARRRPRHGGERPARAAATGTSRCARPASRSATRPTASSTCRAAPRPPTAAVPTTLPIAERDRGDERADDRHAETGAAGVAAGEDRGGGTDGEQRDDRQRGGDDRGRGAAPEQERDDGMRRAERERDERRARGDPRRPERLRIEAELFAASVSSAMSLRRMIVVDERRAASGVMPLRPVDQLELVALLLGERAQLLLLDAQLVLVQLALRADRDPLTRCHRQRTRDHPGDAGEHHDAVVDWCRRPRP